MSEEPYRPSWIDRLTDLIERLPAPPWLVYLVIGLLLVVVFVAVQVWQGTYQGYADLAWCIFIAVQPVYGVMAIHYLDRVAANAIRQFRPAMKGGDNEFDEALYKLTTLPFRMAFIASSIGVLFDMFQYSGILETETSALFQPTVSTSISLAVYNVYGIVAWVVYGVWIYHALHQLKVINWLYTSRAVIDPFYTEPLYALSGISSRTILVVIPPAFGWYLVVTGGTIGALPSELGFILIYSFMLSLALLGISWPLLGAHRLMADAKDRALESNARSYKVAAEELHRIVTARKLDEFDMWHKAVEALDIERRHLDRLATWPWSQGAFRNFMLALVIPILVWIAQYGIQRLME